MRVALNTVSRLTAHQFRREQQLDIAQLGSFFFDLQSKQERKTKRKKLGQNYGTDINSITLAMSLFFVKLSSNGIDGNQRKRER